MADREKERGRGKSLGAQLDEAQQEATNLLADLQNVIHEIQGAAPQGLIQLTHAAEAASANLQIAIQGANQATQELTLATQQAAQATQEATQATQEATQATAALQSVQERVRNVINQLAVSGQSILAILGPAAAAGRYQLHHNLMISIDLLFFVSQVSLLELSMSSLITTLKLLLLLLLETRRSRKKRKKKKKRKKRMRTSNKESMPLLTLLLEKTRKTRIMRKKMKRERKKMKKKKKLLLLL